MYCVCPSTIDPKHEPLFPSPWIQVSWSPLNPTLPSEVDLVLVRPNRGTTVHSRGPLPSVQLLTFPFFSSSFLHFIPCFPILVQLPHACSVDVDQGMPVPLRAFMTSPVSEAPEGVWDVGFASRKVQVTAI